MKPVALIVAALCVVTVWFFNHFPRYENAGGELLKNPGFSSTIDGWDISGEGVELVTGNGGNRVQLSAKSFVREQWISQDVVLSETPALLKLSCVAKSSGIVPGEQDWQKGRLVLLSLDKEGNALYPYPHLLESLTGSHDWHSTEKVFSVAPEIFTVRVAAMLLRASGELELGSCNLQQVKLTQAFVVGRNLLLGLWLVMGAWVLSTLLRRAFYERRQFVALALAGVIAGGVLIPETVKIDLGEVIRHSENIEYDLAQARQLDGLQYFDLTPVWPGMDIFKYGHIVIYFFLSAFLFAARPYRASASELFFCLCLFAVASEVVQLFASNRHPQLADFFVDMSGILPGLLVAVIIQSWKRAPAD